MYNEKSYLKFFGKKFMLLIDQVLQFVRKNLFTFQSFFFGDMTPPQCREKQIDSSLHSSYTNSNE